MQVTASPVWKFGKPCSWQRHPHGNLENHAAGSVTRMEIEKPCGSQHHPHGNLENHAGGCVTCMEVGSSIRKRQLLLGIRGICQSRGEFAQDVVTRSCPTMISGCYC